jgi:hypothetical protein
VWNWDRNGDRNLCKVQKPSNSEYYIPSSEPFRICIKKDSYFHSYDCEKLKSHILWPLIMRPVVQRNVNESKPCDYCHLLSLEQHLTCICHYTSLCFELTRYLCDEQARETELHMNLTANESELKDYFIPNCTKSCIIIIIFTKNCLCLHHEREVSTQ